MKVNDEVRECPATFTVQSVVFIGRPLGLQFRRIIGWQPAAETIVKR